MSLNNKNIKYVFGKDVVEFTKKVFSKKQTLILKNY